MGRNIKSFLGFYAKHTVFLDHRLWVRSVDLSKMVGPTVSTLNALAERHFYIPREQLMRASNEVGAVVTDAGTVAISKEGELRVVQNAY